MVLSKLDPLTIKFFLIQKATEKKKKKNTTPHCKRKQLAQIFPFQRRKSFKQI